MIVIDGSALVDLLAEVRPSGRLRERISGERLHAPQLVDYEVVAGLRRLAFRGLVNDERAVAALEVFGELRIRRWPAGPELRQRAFELRHSVNAYDASYVALAEALECPLITGDAHLARSHGHDAAIELH